MMASENFVKIVDNRVQMEDISYALLNGFCMDLEMSGQSDKDIYWVSEDGTFSIDISAPDTSDREIIESFTTFFPDEYKRLTDFIPFEYNGMTGMYVIIAYGHNESFEFKAYANKEKTKFFEVVIETKREKIYDVLRLKEVQDFLYDIRMN